MNLDIFVAASLGRLHELRGMIMRRSSILIMSKGAAATIDSSYDLDW